MSNPSWWIVLLPGEYAETSGVFGPFRSEQAAEAVAESWNVINPDDKAVVLPLRPSSDLR